ncbi:MAG TPA: hypothetical protein PLV00_06780 [Caldisericia bacterium]|nr:hypothetical protein [Caldisericia bacterium]
MRDDKIKELRKEIRYLKNQIKSLSEIQKTILEYRNEVELFPEEYIPCFEDSTERYWER